jgi:hypothetical protein
MPVAHRRYGLLGGGASNAAVHLFGQRRHDDDDAVSSADAAEHDDDEFRYGGRFITDARGYIDVPAPEDMQARCACTAAVPRVCVRVRVAALRCACEHL